jgi:hypothetical protein
MITYLTYGCMFFLMMAFVFSIFNFRWLRHTYEQRLLEADVANRKLVKRLAALQEEHCAMQRKIPKRDVQGRFTPRKMV